MRIPPSLEPLVDLGVIDEVLRPLMSGKEAQVYLVASHGDVRIAKVYKEASNRSFKHRADYTEGRRVRDSRSQRAMSKRSSFGREQVEAAWRSAEVDAIYRLRAAGVRVPEPYDFIEGVLVMELVTDEDGNPAPRLVDVSLHPRQAEALHTQLIHEVVKMLCAGIVHGDLSDFNVLMGTDGPVIIDFPQATDAAQNRSAKRLLVRDVDNLTHFLARFAPSLRGRQYGMEMWDLYERGELNPDSELTGHYRRQHRAVDVGALLEDLDDVTKEAIRRGQARPPRGGGGRGGSPQTRTTQRAPAVEPAEPAAEVQGPRRRVVEIAPAPSPQKPNEDGGGRRKRRRRRGSRGQQGDPQGAADTRTAAPPERRDAPSGSRPPPQGAPATGDAPARRRRRRRRRSGGGQTSGEPAAE